MVFGTFITTEARRTLRTRWDVKLGHHLSACYIDTFGVKRHKQFCAIYPDSFLPGILVDKCGVRTIPESAAQEIAGDESPEAFFVHWLE